jgi:cytochrome c2
MTLRTSALTNAACLFFVAGCSEAPSRAEIPGADPERGRMTIVRYGCVACHAIPGIANPGSNVGPSLDKIARRAYIGGMLPNTPAEMVRWLRDPPRIDPRTAMPNMGISEAEARDIAAYLYTLD